jgi:hypothetical protein
MLPLPTDWSDPKQVPASSRSKFISEAGIVAKVEPIEMEMFGSVAWQGKE